MFGAMTGDIVGSIYEFNTIKTKEFPLFSGDCSFTDDTVMTVAIARALLRCCGTQETFIRAAEEEMHSLGRKYPYAGYGSRFFAWLLDDCPHPYNSYGNGSAMRVSPCGLIAVTLDEALSLSAASAEVTHNHPEGIKGARAAAAAVFLAKTGSRKEQIAEYIRQNFYPLEETLDEIREYYLFNETCTSGDNRLFGVGELRGCCQKRGIPRGRQRHTCGDHGRYCLGLLSLRQKGTAAGYESCQNAGGAVPSGGICKHGGTV